MNAWRLRRFASMASSNWPSSRATSSPFLRAVTASMQQLYPDEYADKSFDNTGLISEAPFKGSNNRKNKVLLTIDLTAAVADEAIEGGAEVVVAYHPTIFHALKNITLSNSQQKSLLRLAAEGISVYCPHTSVDAAVGGNADWLADVITADSAPHPVVNTTSPHDQILTSDQTPMEYRLDFFAGKPWTKEQRAVNLHSIPHVRSVVKPNPTNPEVGMGRIVRFESPRPLLQILESMTRYFGSPRAFNLAIPQRRHFADIKIQTVGVCCGAGSSVLSGSANIDLFVLGETAHHEALAVIENGGCLISLGHSNSERLYLKEVMQDRLRQTLEEKWSQIRLVESEKSGHLATSKEFRERCDDASVEVTVSQEDRDPYGSLVLKSFGFEDVSQ